MSNIKIKDNSKKVLDLFEKATQNALTAIGMEAESFVKQDSEMPVDTGRARNSVTWATKKQENKSFSYKDDNGNTFSDKIGSGAEEKAVYIGSNVEYFLFIEEGSRNMRARHVLKNAVTQHTPRYKELAKQVFENA